MSEVANKTLLYFQAPKNYFWKWVENGEVIEWKNGQTVCYREELTTILNSLSNSGIPSLGSLLLAIAACQDNWRDSSDKIAILYGLLRSLKEEDWDPSNPILEYHIHQATKFLDVINDLPQEYRKGAKKAHLFFEIFSNSPALLEPNSSGHIVEEFASGRMDPVVFNEGEEIDRTSFLADIEFLSKSLKKYSNSNLLLLKIQTGVKNIPAPVQVNLPDEESGDLLTELAKDPKTSGIARLAKHLVAALHIPMHTKRSSDLSFGGFSDITNRGNFDRLLLSELAQDDALLTARLVNNEALFLRREEPPQSNKRDRVILVDTTLKMWGLPKVFAISAALGCAINSKNGSSVKAFNLGSKTATAFAIDTKKGIIDSLEKLDPALSPKNALITTINNFEKTDSTEFIFISDEETVQDYSFNLLLSELKKPLHFVISVSREGALNFYEPVNNRLRSINSAKFDLEEILFDADVTTPKQRTTISRLPAFLNAEASPLYFPTVGMGQNLKNYFYQKELGVVGITSPQRVLFWTRSDLGARELIQFIEKGQYSIGFDGLSSIYIMVYNSSARLLKLYKIYLNKDTFESTDLWDKFPTIKEVVFKSNLFYLKSEEEFFTYDCISNKIAHSLPNAYPKFSPVEKADTIRTAKRYIYNGYSVLQRVEKIGINQVGQLTLDGHHLFERNNILKFSESKNAKGVISCMGEDPHEEIWEENNLVKFKRFSWRDGSDALIDSRGFIYLKSSDSSIPEITIALIIGKATAAWSSDGAVAGSFYFTDVRHPSSMTASDFYNTYIKRFIQKLK